MLKKISVEDVRIGMYLHKLEGSWFNHPFFRSKFLLDSDRQISALRDSGVEQIWIDTVRGDDVGDEIAVATADAVDEDAQTTGHDNEARRRAATKAHAGAARPAAHGDFTDSIITVDPEFAGSGQDNSLSAELARATRICVAGREQVSGLFNEARLGKAVDPERARPLVNEIAASVGRNPAALISVARLKTHDDYTYMHSVAVCALMIALARRLGLSEEDTRVAGVGGLMHDIGKMAIPLDVLNKPGKLEKDEFTLVKRHAQLGAEWLQRSGASGPVQEIAMHHHEKMDGSGYPHQLSGGAISRLARMGAVCDVYDAVTSDRPYKRGWNPADALRQMASWQGHFDKTIFHAFVKSIGIYPLGALVRLSSERLAVVIEPGSESLLKPRVRVFLDARTREPIAHEVIDLAAPGCRDAIVSPESATDWGLEGLEKLWLP